MHKKYIGFFLLLFSFFTLYGQEKEVPAFNVDLQVKEEPLDSILFQLAHRYRFDLSFNPTLIPERKLLSMNKKGVPLSLLMDELLVNTQLDWKWYNGVLVLMRKKEKPMVSITGIVYDQATREPLIYSNIWDPLTLKGTTTDKKGAFSLSFPRGQRQLKASFVGYETTQKGFLLERDTTVFLFLIPDKVLQEVVIHGSEEENERGQQINQVRLAMKEIQGLPQFLGQNDLMKTLQHLPGVQSGVEGTGGLYVRGGGPDQNLILLDGIPVYNTQHALGFFSTFDNEIVQSLNLYKGAFPARYGGRLSSVLDIRLKEADPHKWEGSLGMGLISAGASLSGPLWSEKTGVVLSARRSYLDLLFSPVYKKFSGGDEVSYSFYDLNIKVHHQFSPKDRLYLNFFKGEDQMKNKYTPQPDDAYGDYGDMKKGWGGTLVGLRHYHAFSSRVMSTINLSYSDFNQDSWNEYQQLEKFKVTYKNSYSGESAIKDFNLKLQLQYQPSEDHLLHFGGEGVSHRFIPGVNRYWIDEDGQEATLSWGGIPLSSMELSLFFEDEWRVNNRLIVNSGLHLSNLLVSGRSYFSIDPRFSLSYRFTPWMSSKIAYSKMSQFLHTLSSNTLSFIDNLWVPVTEKRNPLHSHQFSGGLTISPSPALEVSLEGFYKKLDNLIAYKDNASFSDLNTPWEDQVGTGTGLSRGFECLIRKTKGKTTGWLGYTYSNTTLQFDETINGGRAFPAHYDRPHDVNLSLAHRFNERWDIGFNWIYRSGNPVSLSLQKYQVVNPGNGITEEVEVFGFRNNYRLPSYHRLDVGVNWHKKKRYGELIWSFGLYNAYNRINPLYVYWSTSRREEEKKKKLTQVGVLPILPSIAVKYRF